MSCRCRHTYKVLTLLPLPVDCLSQSMRQTDPITALLHRPAQPRYVKLPACDSVDLILHRIKFSAMR